MTNHDNESETEKKLDRKTEASMKERHDESETEKKLVRETDAVVKERAGCKLDSSWLRRKECVIHDLAVWFWQNIPGLASS